MISISRNNYHRKISLKCQIVKLFETWVNVSLRKMLTLQTFLLLCIVLHKELQLHRLKLAIHLNFNFNVDYMPALELHGVLAILWQIPVSLLTKFGNLIQFCLRDWTNLYYIIKIGFAIGNSECNYAVHSFWHCQCKDIVYLLLFLMIQRKKPCCFFYVSTCISLLSHSWVRKLLRKPHNYMWICIGTKSEEVKYS